MSNYCLANVIPSGSFVKALNPTDAMKESGTTPTTVYGATSMLFL
jgi:hypothetical protein